MEIKKIRLGNLLLPSNALGLQMVGLMSCHAVYRKKIDLDIRTYV